MGYVQGDSACDLHSTHYLVFPLHLSFEMSHWDQVSLCGYCTLNSALIPISLGVSFPVGAVM